MAQHRKRGVSVNIYIQNITAGKAFPAGKDDVRRRREPAASPFDICIITGLPYLQLMVM